MERMMLYFGSFNPIHRGHIALAEYVLDRGLCDTVSLVISPCSPHKEAANLLPELERLEMAQMAVKASRYPDRITPSIIEFLLPRPSYTINTLHFAESMRGGDATFSILMGADQIERFPTWKSAEEILAGYPIWVYPRPGVAIGEIDPRFRLLADAPQLDISSTEVRRRLQQGQPVDALLDPAVADYIRKKDFWSAESYLAELDRRVAANDPTALCERGKRRYSRAEFGPALNDFNRLLELEPDNTEARQYVEIIQEILQFRYTDLYNP